MSEDQNNSQNGADESTVETQSLDTHGTEIESLKKELDEKTKQYLYLAAEFDNYKRNAIKERSDLVKFGAERLARDLVGVLDIFDSALHTELTAENLNSFKTGVELTAKELKSVLERHGISEVASHGQDFNPQFHEALGSEPTDKFKEGQISQILRKAYKYHDRMLRPGQVIVARPLDN